MMQLVTRQTLADTAANRWWNHYEEVLERPPVDARTRRFHAIYAELQALGPNPSPDAVDKVIDNRFWTYFRCQHCTRESNVLKADVA